MGDLNAENVFAKVLRIMFYVGLVVAGAGIFIDTDVSYAGLFLFTLAPLAALTAAATKGDRILKILITVVVAELVAALLLTLARI